MKRVKIMAVSLVSVMLVSSLALPSSAASSYTPTSSNFVPLFDFDTTPTAQYTDGYRPGRPGDTIGYGIGKLCIQGGSNLTIVNGVGDKGNALKLDVPFGGGSKELTLNCQYGENKLPGCTSGKATDFMFWVDTTGYKDTNAPTLGQSVTLGIQETDYDKSGNETSDSTYWELKAAANGGYYEYENGSGGWTKGDVEYTRAMHLPYQYKGWIKIPISNFTTYSIDADGIFDCKKIQQIILNMYFTQSNDGSSMIYDEFGFKASNGTVPAAPTGLISTGKTSTTADLSWTAVPGAVSYNIYNGTTKLNAAPVTATTYKATGLYKNTAYTFTVKAVNDAGESAPSNSCEITTTNCISGDVNGDGVVNSKDATILRRYLAGFSSIKIDTAAADFNNDGYVNSKDSTLLRRVLAGWSVTIP